MAKRHRLGEWDGPSNYSSGYKFTSIPKPEDLTWKLLEYVQLCEYAGVHATKKEFLLDFLGKKLRKDQLTGYLSSLFGSVQDAGIVERKREGRVHYYVKGINADHYRNGTLTCTKPPPVSYSSIPPTTLAQRKKGVRTFTDVRIRPGASVILIPTPGVSPIEFVEDLEYAKKQGDNSSFHTYFFKHLSSSVEFDENDVSHAPWRYYQDSQFRTHPFGFNVYDRWGDKWITMHVRESDIIEKT